MIEGLIMQCVIWGMFVGMCVMIEMMKRNREGR